MSAAKSVLPTSDLAERIRVSARADISKYGVLGLRVTRVANRAHCSVTQIYRHFEDRDGLLADVLARIYEEISEKTIQGFMSILERMTVISVRDVIEMLPTPSGILDREESLLRAQILAVASVNPALRARLSEIARAIYPKWSAACDLVESRLPDGESFDRRVVFVMILNSNLMYNSLLGELATTDDEYKSFMYDAFTMKKRND